MVFISMATVESVVDIIFPKNTGQYFTTFKYCQFEILPAKEFVKQI